MEARVTARVEGRVGVLELTGRNGTNAMDERFVRELDGSAALLAEAAESEQIDVVVLRSLGRHFCVGGDLADLGGSGDSSAMVARQTSFAHRGIAALRSLPIPVLARWQGAAAGGGIGLLLVADIVIAARTASMTAGYSEVGLSPDAGVSWGLPRRLGPEHALSLLLSNRRVPADELVQLGLAAEVVESDELDDRVTALVAQILLVGGAVLRDTKKLVRQAEATALSAHLDDEAQAITAASAGSRFTQAVASYVER